MPLVDIEIIFKLVPIHIFVILSHPWIHWIQWNQRNFGSIYIYFSSSLVDEYYYHIGFHDADNNDIFVWLNGNILPDDDTNWLDGNFFKIKFRYFQPNVTVALHISSEKCVWRKVQLEKTSSGFIFGSFNCFYDLKPKF